MREKLETVCVMCTFPVLSLVQYGFPLCLLILKCSLTYLHIWVFTH